jgi:hypothetical protein
MSSEVFSRVRSVAAALLGRRPLTQSASVIEFKIMVDPVTLLRKGRALSRAEHESRKPPPNTNRPASE